VPKAEKKASDIAAAKKKKKKKEFGESTSLLVKV